MAARSSRTPGTEALMRARPRQPGEMYANDMHTAEAGQANAGPAPAELRGR